MRSSVLAIVLLAVAAPGWPQPQNRGYYRFPAIYGQTIVFTAEGDLWEVGVEGGTARRLTTHPGEETHAAFSPDGRTIAFSANYEGPTEVYTMPASGRAANAAHFRGQHADVVGWTPDGKMLYTTRRYSTLPDRNWRPSTATTACELVPLSQAAQGSYTPDGKTLFFTRLPISRAASQAISGRDGRRSCGSTPPGGEAVAADGGLRGHQQERHVVERRVYFLSDRDGTMNLWSMDENGKGLRQHTRHQGWDLKIAVARRRGASSTRWARICACTISLPARTGPFRSSSPRISTTCASTG